MALRSVVAGAGGAVGRLLTDLLGTTGPVTPVDPTLAGGLDITRTDPSLDRALAAADVVALAVPAPVLAPAVDRVAAAMPPGSLLVQAASVQTPVTGRLRAAARRHGLEAIGLNPMFAPELGCSGRPIAVVDVEPGPRADAFERLLAARGALPVRLTPDRHDALTAGTQAATHAAVLAFGLALRSLGVSAADLLAVATPPHRTLLALLARIASGNPEVYREIQHDHPAAPVTRAALTTALATVGAASSPAEFAAVVDSLRTWLGPARTPLAAHCATLFDAAS